MAHDVVDELQAEAIVEAEHGLGMELHSDHRRGAMAARCLEAAQQYTVENMAQNFCAGIIRCLETYGITGGAVKPLGKST